MMSLVIILLLCVLCVHTQAHGAEDQQRCIVEVSAVPSLPQRIIERAESIALWQLLAACSMLCRVSHQRAKTTLNVQHLCI